MQTVLTGLAPNGGLYIPETIPQLPENWESDWKDYSFIDLCVAILSLYISSDEMSDSEIRDLATKSYASFRDPSVTPLRLLSHNNYVLELWHGPTWAFKDVALQLLGNLFEFFLQRRNTKRRAEGKADEKLTVVGATSGDTGSAAIYGLRNKVNVSVFILHPQGRVSPIQEAQMTTILDDNVHNLAVKGTFDDCQDIVKALFSDSQFNATHRLGAVNSINWARILAQTVYYFHAYLSLRRTLSIADGQHLPVQFVVPTGNFGDILAGYYAKRMGLPMGAKLGVATNSNDILARFWASGRYEKVDSAVGTETFAAVKETLSPAMDILVSSNFERLLWYLAHDTIAAGSSNSVQEACHILHDWMATLKTDGRVEVPAAVLDLARRDFCAERVSDDETLQTIQSHFNASNSYIADPHTAVGLAAAVRMVQHNSPAVYQIILSTAHPAKFSEAVSQALRSSPDFNFERDVLPEEFKGLLNKPKRVLNVEEPKVKLVKTVIQRELDK